MRWRKSSKLQEKLGKNMGLASFRSEENPLNSQLLGRIFEVSILENQPRSSLLILLKRIRKGGILLAMRFILMWKRRNLSIFTQELRMFSKKLFVLWGIRGREFTKMLWGFWGVFVSKISIIFSLQVLNILRFFKKISKFWKIFLWRESSRNLIKFWQIQIMCRLWRIWNRLDFWKFFFQNLIVWISFEGISTTSKEIFGFTRKCVYRKWIRLFWEKKLPEKGSFCFCGLFYFTISEKVRLIRWVRTGKVITTITKMWEQKCSKITLQKGCYFQKILKKRYIFWFENIWGCLWFQKWKNSKAENWWCTNISLIWFCFEKQTTNEESQQNLIILRKLQVSTKISKNSSKQKHFSHEKMSWKNSQI